jgi:hypothetical protein
MRNFEFQIWSDFRRRVDAIGNPIEGEASSKICPKIEDQQSAASPKLSILYLAISFYRLWEQVRTIQDELSAKL